LEEENEEKMTAASQRLGRAADYAGKEVPHRSPSIAAAGAGGVFDLLLPIPGGSVNFS
jgi:hypothetical protein